MKPQLILLAGPNGAGKSTFYDLYLRGAELPFLNADLVAAKTGIDSFAAARLLDAMRDRMIDEGKGFITETVFSDPDGAKLAMLEKAVGTGYDVTLIYVGLSGPDLSELRVAQRVKHGGHDVPREKLASRFERSLGNLKAAIDVVPTIKIYDNSSPDEPYRLVAVVENGKVAFKTIDRPPWVRRVFAQRKRPTPKKR
jgi:predicted ABC-type ATPase